MIRLHLEMGWTPDEVTAESCPGCVFETHFPCEDGDCHEPHYWVLSDVELATVRAVVDYYFAKGTKDEDAAALLTEVLRVLNATPA